MKNSQLQSQTSINVLESTLNSIKFESDYDCNRNMLSKRLLFLNYFDILKRIKSQIKKNNLIQQQQGDNKKQLNINLPKLKQKDKSSILIEKVDYQIKKRYPQHITPFGLLMCFIRANSEHFIKIITFFIIEAISRILLSILLFFLFSSLQQYALENQNIKVKYVICGISSLALVIFSIGRHNGFIEAIILTNNLISTIVTMVFRKVSQLSHYTVNHSNDIGKLINLISNDLNNLQNRFPILLLCLVFPISLTGIIVVVYYRVSWSGLFCVIVPLVLYPLQMILSKINSTLIEKVNIKRDARISLTSDLLKAIKMIKINGWEIGFKKMVEVLRKQQLRQYVKLAVGTAIQKALSKCSTTLGVLISIWVSHEIEGNRIDSIKVISLYQLMIFIQYIIWSLTYGGGYYFQLKILLQRIVSILNTPNIQMHKLQESQSKLPPQVQKSMVNIRSNSNHHQLAPNQTIKLIQVSIFWSLKSLPTLKNISVTFEKGKMYGIGGKIGSGKSVLINTILKQIPYYEGQVLVDGDICYVEQQPILFSATIRDNILFKKSYQKNRYNEAIRKSCLQADINGFKDGDETMVGERGTTLSGGQRTRLSLARAIYSNADIYLFDDPLSAVDLQVGQQMFSHWKKAQNKTIILVTHHTNYLQQCDKVLLLQNGQVFKFDRPQNLCQQLNNLKYSQSENQNTQTIQHNNTAPQDDHQVQQNKPTIHQNTPSQTTSKLKIFLKYITYSKINILLFPATIMFYLIAEASKTIYFRYLANTNQSVVSQVTWYYLGILQIAYLLFMIGKYTLLNIVILNSNRKIHKKMIDSIVRTPLSYFDITPSANIINHFSNDIGILDNYMNFTMADCIDGIIVFIVVMVNIFSINYYFIVVGISSIIAFLAIFALFKNTILYTKQLQLQRKNPIISKLNQLIFGIIPINIYHQKHTFNKQFQIAVDESIISSLISNLITRTFEISVTMFAMIMIILVLFVGVMTLNVTNVGLYAVSVVFLMQMFQLMSWCLNQCIGTQSTMINVERCSSVTALPNEGQFILDNDPHTNTKWNINPNICITNLNLKYRPNLPLVLSDINLNIPPKQKLAIVGRTGAGKSSIIQALLRITQPEIGSKYHINQVDALKIGLHSLRHNISVISQTPFLLSSTIKANIDPFGCKSDEQIWSVLELVKLKQHIQSLPKQLQTQLLNDCEIFSLGKKQLICLARAILRNNSIIILDEATSNIDMNTDEVVQNLLKHTLADKTVITIAHRLETIVNYDKIIVLEDGKIKLSGTPLQLIQKKGSFYSMVIYSSKQSQKIINMIQQK